MKMVNPNKQSLVLGHPNFSSHAILMAQAFPCRCPSTVPCRLNHMNHAEAL